MAEEEFWRALQLSQWGFARKCVASSGFVRKEEEEEGEFDHGLEVVGAAWLAGRWAQNG